MLHMTALLSLADWMCSIIFPKGWHYFSAWFILCGSLHFEAVCKL